MLAKRSPQQFRDADHLVVELDHLSIHVPTPRESQKLIGQLRSEICGVLRLLEQRLRLVALEMQFGERQRKGAVAR